MIGHDNQNRNLSELRLVIRPSEGKAWVHSLRPGNFDPHTFRHSLPKNTWWRFWRWNAEPYRFEFSCATRSVITSRNRHNQQLGVGIVDDAQLNITHAG